MDDDAAFATLVTGARAGDPDALTQLYQRHQSRLVRVLRAEVGDAADDVASQTWLEVMRALRRFEGDEQGFRALLYTIARRRVADHRRTDRRRPATPMAPEDLPSAPDRRPGADPGLLADATAEEAVALISRVLQPHQAEIVLLRVVAGLSVEEVAAIVGRSVGAVRVQQHRALRRLADVLTEGVFDDL